MGLIIVEGYSFIGTVCKSVSLRFSEDEISSMMYLVVLKNFCNFYFLTFDESNECLSLRFLEMINSIIRNAMFLSFQGIFVIYILKCL